MEEKILSKTGKCPELSWPQLIKPQGRHIFMNYREKINRWTKGLRKPVQF